MKKPSQIHKPTTNQRKPILQIITGVLIVIISIAAFYFFSCQDPNLASFGLLAVLFNSFSVFGFIFMAIPTVLFVFAFGIGMELILEEVFTLTSKR